MRSSKGTGIGIANIERRLKLSYVDNTDGLEIRSEEGYGTSISLKYQMNLERGKTRENYTHRR